MKLVYPVVINTSKEKSDEYYSVYIPDLDIYTEGKDIADCIEMARDAIGINCLTLEENLKKPFPKQSDFDSITCKNNQIKTLVDVNYDEYKKQHSMKTVRRNVTLPSWINYAADKSGINVSAVLQNALKQELNLSDRP